MNKRLFQLTTSITSVFLLLISKTTSAQAQITNPAIPDALGSDAAAAASGTTFTSYIVTLWQALIFVGGLLVVLYFLWGAIEWISAGGEQAKIGKARDKMTQAVIGMIVLVGTFTIVGLISQLFFPGMNLLQLTIPTPAGGGQ